MSEFVELEKFLWEEPKITFEDILNTNYPDFEEEIKILVKELNDKGFVEENILQQVKEQYEAKVKQLKEAEGKNPKEFYIEEHALKSVANWGSEWNEE